VVRKGEVWEVLGQGGAPHFFKILFEKKGFSFVGGALYDVAYIYVYVCTYIYVCIYMYVHEILCGTLWLPKKWIMCMCVCVCVNVCDGLCGR